MKTTLRLGKMPRPIHVHVGKPLSLARVRLTIRYIDYDATYTVLEYYTPATQSLIMEMMAADNAPNASLPNTLNMIWRIACLRRDDNLPAHELALAIVSLYGQVN